VLRGIEMPCNLTPLTNSSIDFVRRAAFASSTHPAQIVGPAVADELERLGMAFESTSENTALARRADHTVRVGVHELGPRRDARATADFAHLPANSVVVDFELA
jgi:hypothetical protein